MGKSKSLKREHAGSLSSDIQEEIESSTKRESLVSSPDPTLASSPSPELHSFDTDAESRCSEDVSNSVQCVYFVQSFMINNVITTPTLWIGTSRGSIYIYTITMPASDCRTSDPVVCQLGKEIQLKHQASVLNIQVIDNRGYPLPDPTYVQYQRAKPADLCGSHRVVVCTEEQIKVFTLPSMKPYCKNKIALIEGYHIAKVGFTSFPNKNDPKTCEYCLICLSSSNGITLYNMPEIRKFISYNYCSLEDIEISTKASFAHNGLLASLSSPSELEIISLSTAITAKAVCKLELCEGIRNSHKPLENIVLDMQSISLQNGSANLTSQSNLSDAIHPEVQNELNEIESASAEARRLSVASSRILNENQQQDRGDNHSVQSAVQVTGDIQQQIKRAPLAAIEELNSSEESHLNCINHSSRSFCGSHSKI